MIYKLRKNQEFRLVYRRGKSYANKLLVLYVFNNKKNILIDRINIIIVTNIDTFFIFFSLVICFFNDINTGINKIKL